MTIILGCLLVTLIIYLAGICITQQERIYDLGNEKDLLKDQLHWIRLDDLTQTTLKIDFERGCA